MAGPTQIFDRALLDARRRRALKGGAADFLLRRTADDLVERLKAVKRHFPLAVEIGGLSPLLAERLGATGQVGRLIRMDRLAETGAEIVGDEESLPFRAESLDLVVSALAFQFTDDLPGAFAQIRRALKPDGLFLAALLGGDTLDRAPGELRRGGGGADRRGIAAGGAVRRTAGRRRPLAARRLRPAGDRPGPRHRPLCRCARADARSPRHGRGQCARRAQPAPAPRVPS